MEPRTPNVGTLMAALFGPVARAWRNRGVQITAGNSKHHRYTRARRDSNKRRARARIAKQSRRRNRRAQVM